MSGNALPQFAKNGVISAARVTAANTSSDGGGTIGTDCFVVVTADATNGTWIDSVRWIPTASVAGTAMTATVGRLFVSSQTSGSVTNANTHLIDEVTLAAQTADSSSAATFPLDRPCGFRLPAGYTLLATNHAAPASNTAWRAVAFGGDF